MRPGILTALLFICVLGSAAAQGQDAVLQLALVDRMEYRAAYEELVRRFEAQHPGVRVEILTLPGGSLRDERLAVLLAGGAMPDVWGEGGATATYTVLDWVLDLTPYVARDRAELDIDDFLPAAWANVARGGKIIGLPWGTSVSALAYNRDLLAAAGLPEPPVSWSDGGWTYERLVQYARQLTRRTPEGLVETYGFDYWVWEDYLLVWARLFGGDWFDAASYKTGVVERVVINAPENLAAYEALYGLMHEERVMPPPSGAPWAAAPTHWEPFTAGRVAMRITSGWAFDMHISAGLADWALAAIPAFPAGRQGIVANDAWHVWKGTRHPDLAWELVKFLSSPDAMLYFTEQTLFGPARISALGPYARFLADALGMSPAAVVDVLIGAQTYGVESPDHLFHGWADLRAVPAAVFARVWANTLPVPAALEEAQRRLQSVADELRAKLGGDAAGSSR